MDLNRRKILLSFFPLTLMVAGNFTICEKIKFFFKTEKYFPSFIKELSLKHHLFSSYRNSMNFYFPSKSSAKKYLTKKIFEQLAIDSKITYMQAYENVRKNQFVFDEVYIVDGVVFAVIEIALLRMD